jgi:hypothetical protein
MKGADTMKSTKTLIKTDRNGTKYWNVTDVCPRCGGIGDYIQGINYGVCFLCGGSGTKNYIFKEYTPEHEAKLEAARQKREAARIAKQEAWKAEHAEEIEAARQRIIIERYAQYGCGKDGIGYVLTGKTYPVKEEIKKNGGRWVWGTWICPVEVKANGVQSKKINLDGHIGSGSEVWLNGYSLDDAIAE